MAEPGAEAQIEMEEKQPATLTLEASGDATGKIAEGAESLETLPPLTYIDFLPQCLGAAIEGKEPQFADFGSLIEQANQWLTSMPQFAVYKCETIDTKLTQEFTTDADVTLTHRSSNGRNVYVRGLRLWLIPKQEPSQAIQQLAYVTVLPDHESGNLKSYLQSLAGTNVSPISGDTTIPSFDDLPKTVEKLNKHLAVKPLPGKILTVETMVFKAQESNSSETLNTEDTVWSESGSASKFFLYALRIFYVLGQPAYETIGVYDEKPDMHQTQEGLAIRLKFSNFGSVLTKATHWLQRQQGVRVTNIQTLDIKLERRYGSGPWVFNTDSPGFTTAQTLNENRYTKILRVYYIKDQKMDSASPYASITMTSRLFVPNKLEPRLYESFSQTMLKAIKWLNATRIPLFACETVKFPITGMSEGQEVNEDRTDTLVNTHAGRLYLTCVRLYFPSIYQEPPEEITTAVEEGWGWYACVIS